jgi:hypothetical protein
VGAFRGAGSGAVIGRQRAVAEAGVGIAGLLVVDREAAGEVADGRWGPGRGRLREESTESEWTVSCESCSYLLYTFDPFAFCALR